MNREAVARELVQVAKELTSERRMEAATEVHLMELIDADPWLKGLLKKLASAGKVFTNPTHAWSGVHGNIIEFGPSSNLTFEPSDLKKIGSLPKVRWIDFGGRNVSVGVEGSWIG